MLLFISVVLEMRYILFPKYMVSPLFAQSIKPWISSLDFEEWIKLYRENEGAIEIVVHYDFDRAVIDCDDYLYIYSEQGDPWEDGNIVFYYYDVCFYDTQTNTLYRFKSKT